MTTPILGTPSAYQLTRAFFLAECPGRGWPTNFTVQVPDPLPTGRRFWTLEQTNTVKPFEFVTAPLMQLRYYDPNYARGEQISNDAFELWVRMPSPDGPVQDVEHAGGPVPRQDPNYPDLWFWSVTCWVNLMNTPYA